ncbi:hypothetical protein [Arthrobacter sp. 31Y]|uniref:hypothetical protein n=1 Tax=Arthrobacter sp. 31Y TaxID=1115632 RepID=UPI00046777DD|nr:hypothetical protein [Arthrobacter sp. 31Y]
MDQETLRLVVTAGVALIAGLGGAGLSAWINRKNTVETLTSTKERDHTMWLRNRKQEAYAEFLAVADGVLKASWNEDESSPDLRSLTSLTTELNKLKLVGSDETIRLAAEICYCAATAYGYEHVIGRLKDRTDAASKLKLEEVMEKDSNNLSVYSNWVDDFVQVARVEFGGEPLRRERQTQARQ